ncbi:MAG TPA: hypothetical protein VFF30_18070 [Nitrososphaerales archaeon]|nr:hypothetical protein [Nitrososphaerales archaeon]
MKPGRFSISNSAAISIVLTFVVIGLGVTAALVYGGTSKTTTSTTTITSTTTWTMEGVVTGYVQVGPSQPVCQENQSCTVDLTGYSLLFSNCPFTAGTSSTANTNCQRYSAAISPSGHYSILLPAGTFYITGLNPSCTWMGCSSTFPKTVVVEGGMQLVVNVDIDTGIR